MKIYWVVERRGRENRDIFARPNGLRVKDETTNGPGPVRKKKELYQWSGGGRRLCTELLLRRSNRERKLYGGRR